MTQELILLAIYLAGAVGVAVHLIKVLIIQAAMATARAVGGTTTTLNGGSAYGTIAKMILWPLYLVFITLVSLLRAV